MGSFAEWSQVVEFGAVFAILMGLCTMRWRPRRWLKHASVPLILSFIGYHAGVGVFFGMGLVFGSARLFHSSLGFVMAGVLIAGITSQWVYQRLEKTMPSPSYPSSPFIHLDLPK